MTGRSAERNRPIQLLVRAIALCATTFAATPTDICHVSSIATDHFATLTTCLTRLIGGELVRCTLLVSGTSTLSRDFSLLLPVH
jgi:hypothetical protein